MNLLRNTAKGGSIHNMCIRFAAQHIHSINHNTETRKMETQGNTDPPKDHNGLNRYVCNISSNRNKYAFFSAPHGNFSKLGHILGHKARLTNYKGTEKKSLKKLEKKCKNPKNQMKMKA